MRGIKNVQWRAHGYRNLLEQSERPEGPYIPEFRDVTEVHDQADGRFRSVMRLAVYPAYKTSSGALADSTTAARIAPGGLAPDSPEALSSARETLALSPEHLLMTALGAPDVRRWGRAIVQAVPQDVVTFSFDGAPARLFLNAYTHLPTALDYSGPLAQQDYWRFVGDVRMRTYYSFWMIGSGVRMPMQWDVYRNGLHDSAFTIESLSINRPIAEHDMEIPAQLRVAFSKWAHSQPAPSLASAVVLAPAITMIPGPWNVLLVRQSDGIVVIEAPISSDYSELVLKEIARRYPGVPVKAVVSTSDAWPHIAGIRPYVARGIPIFSLDLNGAALIRLTRMSYNHHPDALSRTPRRIRLTSVAARQNLGSGDDRIELYPFRGETSERQLMVYFPGARLVYGSDSFQANRDGTYDTPETVDELIAVVTREHLRPRSFVTMHIPMTPWADLLKAGIAPTQFPEGLDGQ